MKKRTTGHEHSGLRRFFTSRLFLISLFALAFLVALSYARAYYQDYAVRQEIKQLEEEVRRLEHKKLESFELLKYVSSDAYVEEKARTEFQLKKPGEHVVVIEDTAVYSTDDTQATEGEGQGLKNPQKWWYYILHKPLPNT